MSERRDALEAFDRDRTPPKNVSLVLIDIPFWELVGVIVKCYFAFLVASLAIGIVLGVAFGVFLYFAEPM